MSHKIISYENIEIGGDEYLAIETKGDLQYMPQGIQSVYAIYGIFERTEQGTLLYTTSILRENDGSICGNPDSEYCDDYNALKKGNVTDIDRLVK